MLTKTIPDRVFHVKDARGRTYKVTRYAWLNNVSAEDQPEEWHESWHLLMTENGGFLDPMEDGRYCVDGTGTLVEVVEGDDAPRSGADANRESLH